MRQQGFGILYGAGALLADVSPMGTGIIALSWEDCELLLTRWAYWGRTSRVRGKAWSAEGAYKSPQIWDDIHAKPLCIVRFSEVDAWRVELAWRRQSRPDQILLQFWYPYWQRRPPGIYAACRRAKVPRHEHEDRLLMAKAAICGMWVHLTAQHLVC